MTGDRMIRKFRIVPEDKLCALLEGFKAILIERDAQYAIDAQERLNYS